MAEVLSYADALAILLRFGPLDAHLVAQFVV